MTSDAVTLFAERARAVRQGFGIFDEQTADAVIEICETLDGLPLGIELAAARMAAMSAVEVRDRLGDRFRLLTGPELAPDRQTTLRHAMAWSYDLLDDDERAALRTASVFAGGFDLPALCAVAEASDDIEVLRLLDSLVRKSLVSAHHGSARTRYSLFETIRTFADERLAEAAERDAARDRHAAYFAAEAARRWEQWNGPAWRTQVDWVQTELANLRVGVPVERRSRSRRGGHRHRRARRSDGVLGGAVRDHRVGRVPARRGDPGRRPPAPAAVRRGGVCVLRRTRRGRDRERPPGDRAGGPAGLRVVRARLRDVHRGARTGLLRQPGSLHRADPGRGRAAGRRPGVRDRRVRRRPAVGRTGRRGAGAHRACPSRRRARSAIPTGWSTRCGSSGWRTRRRTRSARWRPGTRASRELGEHDVRFFEGFLARDAALLHTSDGQLEAALTLFGTSIGAFLRSGAVAQLVITLASLPALFERLDRPGVACTLLGAMANEPASLHHVPTLADLGERLDARLGDEASARFASVGGAMDLHDAAAYAVHQIDLARRALTAPASTAARSPA